MITKESIFDLIKKNLLDVLPDLDPAQVVRMQSMKNLGANSIDRVDVIIATMEALDLKFPLNELGAEKYR